MYLSVDEARRALAELDRCVVAGSRVLVLEPCREFNSLVRMLLRRKGKETLSRPGFSLSQMCDELPPSNWQRLGAGGCAWMTAFLPALAIVSRFPRAYAVLGRLVLRLDRPHLDAGWRPGRLSMYRWAVYMKT